MRFRVYPQNTLHPLQPGARPHHKVPPPQVVGGPVDIVFGGEGVYYSELTGPGVVLIQSLPAAQTDSLEDVRK